MSYRVGAGPAAESVTRYGSAPRRGALANGRGRVVLTRILAAAFIIRGVISVSDGLSVATDGLRPLPIIGPMAFSAISPLWSLLWAALAVIAGVGLGLRWRVGWLVGTAVAVAYLVSGMADLSLLDWSGDVLRLERLVAVSIDLLVPAAALSLLSITRVAQTKPVPAPGRSRREAAGLAQRAGIALVAPRRRAAADDGERGSDSPLERWRHRR